VQRAAGEDDAGVVVGEVESAEALERRGDEVARLHRVDDVGGEERGAAWTVGELHRLLAAVLVDVDDEDVGAGGDQGERGGAADPRARPGHQAGAAGERGAVEGRCHRRPQ
jgi:hypothetical protein